MHKEVEENQHQGKKFTLEDSLDDLILLLTGCSALVLGVLIHNAYHIDLSAFNVL